MDLKEIEKKEKLQAKIAQEKEMRDVQLKRNQHAQRKEKRENEALDAAILKRIENEIEQDR